MDNADRATDLLVAAAEEYAPKKTDDGVTHLQELGLFIDIRQLQAMDAGVVAVFISEFNASPRSRQKGITITCVGWQADMAAAVGDAVTQWAVGVLPVLAHWRGKHSCFATSGPLETRRGPFDLLAGPVIARGRSDDESPPAADGASLADALIAPFRQQSPVQRVHWLELYCCKKGDGGVDASCRLDNREWRPGREILAGIASAWPASPEPMQSSRQFAMLLPTAGDRQEITVPSFLSWLFGRA